MPLESVTHLSDLNLSNPPGSDGLSQADDHIRNIKKALLTDLPGITGVVNATQAQLNLLNSIAALTVLANATNGAAQPTAIAAALDGQIFRRSGTALAFGAIDFTLENAVLKPEQSISKSADTSRASTTVKADDPHLTGFTIKAAKLYQFEAFIFFTYATTPNNGLKFDFRFTQTPQIARSNMLPLVDTGATGTVGVPVPDLSVEFAVSTNSSWGATMMAYMQGVILGHATNDGLLHFEWAQNSSNVVPIIVKAGSYIKLTRLN